MGKNISSGFTLLEVLLAIFIFGIVVTTVFGSFNFISSTVGRIEEAINTGDMAKNAMDRMIIDLSSIYVTLPPVYKIPGFNDDPESYRVVGEAETLSGDDVSKLRFTSFEHLPFGKDTRSGIAEIVYYVQETDDNSKILKRSDSLYPYEDFKEKDSDPILCEQLKSLVFTFYDDEEKETNDWNSESDEFGYGTPVAIGIQLEIGDDESSSLYKTMVKLPLSRKKESNF